MNNTFFASVFSNHLGFNVLIIEIDRANNSLLLRHSKSSDMLSINSIVGIIKPFVTDFFGMCYFNFVECDKSNLVPIGVVELIDCERVLLKVSENPESSLSDLAVKMNDGGIKIKSHLSGNIHTDLKRTTKDEMSHQIANLTHIADNWDMLVYGDRNTIVLGELKDRFYDLDGLTWDDRRRL